MCWVLACMCTCGCVGLMVAQTQRSIMWLTNLLLLFDSCLNAFALTQLRLVAHAIAYGAGQGQLHTWHLLHTLGCCVDGDLGDAVATQTWMVQKQRGWRASQLLCCFELAVTARVCSGLCQLCCDCNRTFVVDQACSCFARPVLLLVSVVRDILLHTSQAVALCTGCLT
ncbi:hypothetical protein COO60DRAFT_54848 [Scenedesmus sp. NREL 46B-D3]|nr:hypothetical protein COO60DRAFT_54848 [Scenedesmus sp. NREL 46B-D3]